RAGYRCDSAQRALLRRDDPMMSLESPSRFGQRKQWDRTLSSFESPTSRRSAPAATLRRALQREHRDLRKRVEARRHDAEADAARDVHGVPRLPFVALPPLDAQVF